MRAVRWKSLLCWASVVYIVALALRASYGRTKFFQSTRGFFDFAPFEEPLMARVGENLKFGYPTRPAVGSDVVKPPLQHESLLRLVPGDARRSLPPIQWRGKAPSISEESSLVLVLRRSARQRNVAVKLEGNGFQRPDVWLDFLFNSSRTAEFELGVTLFAVHEEVDDSALSKIAANGISPQLNSTRLCHGALLASDFQERSVGALTRALTDPEGNIAGNFTFEYVVTKPYPGALLPARAMLKLDDTCFPRFVGHRGCGSSKTGSILAENSVKSFKTATSGPEVHHVELDVQLSSDNVPIIFHDWSYSMRTHNMFLRNMSASDFLSLQAPPPKHAQTPVEPQSVTSLTHVCESLPADVGVLVELKYPPPNVQRREGIPYADHNQLVDSTLKSLFEEAALANKGRSIAFLSFDADVCNMLALKQASYPVLFLHCEERDGDDCDDADPRTVNIETGTKFALSQKFAGMVIFAEMVLEDKTLARRARESGLSILTYGSENANPELARHQIHDLGVQGVIADDVVHVAEAVSPKLPAMNCNIARGS